MAISAGDLYVGIAAPGATEAERALHRVDAAAQQVARTTNAATGGLRTMLTRTTDAFRTTLSGGAGGGGGLAGVISAIGSPAALLGVTAAGVAIGAATSALRLFATEADEARRATQSLRGAAIDTGRSFADVRREADTLRVAYRLTHEEAATLARATARVEAESDTAGASTAFLSSAMITATARGYDQAQAVDVIAAAVTGNAEAIRQLTGLKPDELYDRYAKRANRAGKDLSDVGKQQALVNGAMEEAQRRTTDAADAFDPLISAQRDSEVAMKELRVQLGDSLTPLRTFINEAEAGFARLASRAIPAIGSALRTLGSFVLPGPITMGLAMLGKKGAAGTTPTALPPILATPGPDAFDPKKPNAVKAVRDETDKLISSLVTLREGNQQTAADMAVVIRLYDAERAVIDKGTASVDRRAQALERMKRLEAAGIITPDAIIQQREARPQLDMTAPAPIPVPQIPPEAYATFETSVQAFRDHALGIITSSGLGAAIGTAMSDQIGLAWENGIADGLQTLAADFAMLTTNVFSAALDAIAAGFAGGWDSFGAVLLGGLGSVLMAMGKHLLTTGAALVGLLPALSNPFSSGPAMIAAGALIFGAGAALSAIAGRGGGGSAAGGGGGAGGIGSLGIGGTAANPYAFAAGSRVNGYGFQGAAETRQPVTVNATIIGPNDVNAQRAIKQLVSNAERRGIA